MSILAIIGIVLGVITLMIIIFTIKNKKQPVYGYSESSGGLKSFLASCCSKVTGKNYGV